MTQKLVKLKRKSIMITVIIISLLKNLIRQVNDRRLKQANLTTKAYTADFIKKTDFNERLKNLNKLITSNKTADVLVEDELQSTKL